MLSIVLAAATWVGTWGASPVRAVDGRRFAGDTLRQVVHVSASGTLVRVRLTNRFGDAPLVIADAAVAVKAGGQGAVEGTTRRLTFMGSPSITIPPHADVLSDQVALNVPPRSDLLVDLYLPASSATLTEHTLAYETNYLAQGDRTGQSSGASFTQTYESWYVLDAIDVCGGPAQSAIVALGDSITDGAGGKVDANDRWTDYLAAQLQVGILDEGISGNRILLSDQRFGIDALARLDADVLSQSGARAAIVLLGINDIQQTPHEYDAQRIEQGLAQIAARVRARGLRVIGGTITPYGGWMTYDPQGEATRLAVNEFIRRGGVFDAVVDFDAALRDARDPHRLAAAYDSGDHLHPNAAGHRVMAMEAARLLVRAGIVVSSGNANARKRPLGARLRGRARAREDRT